MAADDSNQNGSSNDFLWGVAFFIGVIILAWIFGRSWIIGASFFIRGIEASIVGLFTHALDPAVNAMQLLDRKTMEFPVLKAVNADVGRYSRWLFAPILGFLAYRVYTGSISSGFKKKMDMKRLSQEEVKIWPQIRPVIGKDYIHDDINTGRRRMAQNVLEFSYTNRLIAKAEIGDGYVIDQDAAALAMEKQLGRRWSGVAALRPPDLGLVSVFFCRMNGDQKLAIEILNFLAQHLPEGKSTIQDQPGFDQVKLAIEKYEKSDAVRGLNGKHAYERTMLASMLERSRVDGVLASSSFIWLKEYDRVLWYVMNDVGRRVCVAEVGGPWSHWLAEKKFGSAIEDPMVGGAVDALVAGFSEVICDELTLSRIKKEYRKPPKTQKPSTAAESQSKGK